MADMIFTMKNTRTFISDSPMYPRGDITPADFQGVTWIEINGLFNVGELGGEQGINEFELINSDWVVKSKGTRNGGTMANVYIPMHLDPGQQKFREAINDDCNPYAFRIERGADCAPQGIITATVGEPGVIAWAGSDFAAGQPVMFTAAEGGAVPGGLTDGVVYYVVADGLTADSFSVAATAGGPAIEITSAGTGDITAVAPPAGMTDLFFGLATDGARSGGARNDNYTRTFNIAVTGPIITI